MERVFDLGRFFGDLGLMMDMTIPEIALAYSHALRIAKAERDAVEEG